jgi:hypothetical protein
VLLADLAIGAFATSQISLIKELDIGIASPFVQAPEESAG